jgi:PAS domain S-box-containing protein
MPGIFKRLFGSRARREAAELLRMNLSLRDQLESGRLAEARAVQSLERERIAGQAKLRAFFDAASQPMVVVSGNGRIVLTNRRTAEMFGYEPAEIEGQPLETLLPERFRDAHVAHRDSYFQEPRVRAMGVGMDLAGRRKDGSEFPVEVGLSCVETDGEVLAFGLIIDISERKRSERELSRVNAELRRSNAELEQFTYVASHDLQEPLRMVTNYLQLLERRHGSKLDREALEFLNYAVEGATRMKTLIQDLLRLSRAGRQAVNLAPVSADALMESVLSNLQVSIAESRAVITCDPLPQVIADEGLLAHVFQNLVANAIKFRARGVAPRIHVSAARKDGEWIFAVRDNGIGIEPQHRERIFRIFERLHSADVYAGSGVGLAIAQRIVERHGGRIWLESNLGEGSTFFFSVPAQAARSTTAAG